MKNKGNFNFKEALDEMVNGEKVTRLEWENKGEYGFLMGGVLMIRREFKNHQWILSEGDIQAEDWVLI